MRTEREKAGLAVALSDLEEGDWGVIQSMEMPSEIQNQLMHMGFMPGAPVQSLRRAPAGDPTVYSIDGSEVALRRETAQLILVIAGAPEESPA